jgi:hypothetical protein
VRISRRIRGLRKRSSQGRWLIATNGIPLRSAKAYLSSVFLGCVCPSPSSFGIRVNMFSMSSSISSP